ncbi:MAG: ATP synthase F1 subunit delta [Clostridia bacterium]|nr:ATP synthase F1 subunit delta [Clostridia bacterium]
MISTSNDFASSLFMLAMEENKLSEYQSDLSIIKAVFDENPDYVLLLSSPGIPKNERTTALDKAFGNRINIYVLNFLKVLCEHGKVGALDDCIKIFGELKKQAENRITAKVTSAEPLDNEQTEKLKANLSKKLGCQVYIKPVVDRSILGGIKVEFDDKVIDGSIKKQLNDIKEVIGG